MKRNFGIAIHLTLLLLPIVWITSCSGTKKATSETNYEAQVTYTPQIIFLNYSLELDSLEGYKIELINKIVSNGTTKPSIHDHSEGKSGDLRCLSLDTNKQPISDIIIPDPLTKRIEYLKEDNSLASRQIKLDHAEFSVRMQLDSVSKFIAIERIDPSGSSQLIITKID